MFLLFSKIPLHSTMKFTQRNHPHLKDKLLRMIWRLTWLLFFRPSPVIMHTWRCFLLRIFGAKLGTNVFVYPTARIWAPWNLEMGDYSTLADYVDCYSVDKIKIGVHSTVSQYSYLCSATHDYERPNDIIKSKMPLITAPIFLGDQVWVTADVFVGPGVSIGDGTVVLARSTVVHDLQPWVVAAGNPATMKKKRTLRCITDKGVSQ